MPKGRGRAIARLRVCGFTEDDQRETFWIQAIPRIARRFQPACVPACGARH